MRSCTDTFRGTGLSSNMEHGFGLNHLFFNYLNSQGKVFSLLYPMGALSKLSFSTGVFLRDPPQAIQLCHPHSVAKAVI